MSPALIASLLKTMGLDPRMLENGAAAVQDIAKIAAGVDARLTALEVQAAEIACKLDTLLAIASARADAGAQGDAMPTRARAPKLKLPNRSDDGNRRRDLPVIEYIEASKEREKHERDGQSG